MADLRRFVTSPANEPDVARAIRTDTELGRHWDLLAESIRQRRAEIHTAHPADHMDEPTLERALDAFAASVSAERATRFERLLLCERRLSAAYQEATLLLGISIGARAIVLASRPKASAAVVSIASWRAAHVLRDVYRLPIGLSAEVREAVLSTTIEPRATI